MDQEEEFDFSDWTVVDEDIGDSSNSQNKNHTKATTRDRRRSTNVRGSDKNAKPKSVSRSENHSGTTARNQSPKQTSSKTGVASKDVASKDVASKDVASKDVASKDVASKDAHDAGKTESEAMVSSGKGEADKNVVEPAACASTVDSGKDGVEPTSEKAAPVDVSCEARSEASPGNMIMEGGAAHTASGTTEISCLEYVHSTPLIDAPGGLSSVSDVTSLSHPIAEESKSDLSVVTPVTSSSTSSSIASSVPPNEAISEVVSSELSGSTLPSLAPTSLVLNSTESENTDENVTCSQEAGLNSESTSLTPQSEAKPVASVASMTPATSTISTESQLTSQTTSSRTPSKIASRILDKSIDVESIAEIMAAVGKEDAHITCCEGVEDVSDTELTDTMDLTNSRGIKSEKSKTAGVKRDASPTIGGPAIKKTKVQNSKSSSGSTQVASTSAACDQPVKKDSAPADQNNGNQNQKSPKQQNQSNKSDNIKTSRNQVPGGMSSSTPRGSSTTAKTPATKMKTPPAAPAKTNNVDTRPGTSTSSTTVKRIIRRFHRMTQTMSAEYSNKLVQCLIKIPSLDAPPKPDCHKEVQVAVEKAKDEVFYQKALPETVRPEIFKVVSAFNVDDPGSRNIFAGSYGHGISFGHVTAADLEKGTFRENLLTKSAYYSVFFNRQDSGVVDLFFGEEEHFLTVVTQIRKTRIGPRHLVVTYCKTLKEDEQAPEFPVSSVKATIIYNQNFATTNFLAHTKAPAWNKPKVEEILTIHNMPEGIPLDFLKLIIPDARSIELDDKNQKFTQKGSCVHLGMDRKTGDVFLKLFAQMYINNECLAFSAFSSSVSNVPDLAEILKEKKSREKEVENQRELKAVSRDISATPYVAEKEQLDVVMEVETEASAVKNLSLPMSAAGGPSTLPKLQQPMRPPVSNRASAVDSSKNPAFSDVSDELSDISDTSDIGVETAGSKTGQKNVRSPARRKYNPLVNKTSRFHHLSLRPRQTEKKGGKNESVANASKTAVRKTSVSTSKISERRKDTRDRLIDKNQKSSLPKPPDKSIRGVRSSRPHSHDVHKERHDRVNRVSSSDREKGRSAHRPNIPGNRVSDEPTSRDKSQRDRPRLESAKRGSYDKVSGHRDHERNADDRGARREHSSSRTEKTKHKSEEKDTRRPRVTPAVDRHGSKIINVRDSRESNRKTYGSQENKSRTFSDSKMVKLDGYRERDDRRGNRLDLLLQKRLGSLERQEREADDSRQVILTRSRSPITRQIFRGRSASPRKQQLMSVSSVKVRQTSPSGVYRSQQRFQVRRRSRTPPHASHSSVLSPVSAGEDETHDLPEGMWLPQPPTTLDSHQGTRRAGSSNRSASHVRQQAGWKSQISSDVSEKEALAESESARFIEQFVQEMIGTARASARSAESSQKPLPPAIHDPAKVIEKIREIYNSSLNANEDVSDNEDELLKSAVTRDNRSMSRSAGLGQASSKNAARLASDISSSSSHDMDLEPADRLEKRDDHERNSRSTGDVRRFDSPVSSRSRDIGREAGSKPSQAPPREYADSRISDWPSSRGFVESRASDRLNSRGFAESRESDRLNSRESRESDRLNFRGYAESRVFDLPSSKGYLESRETDRPNSRGYLESRVLDQPRSRSYAESRVSDQPSFKGFTDCRVSDQPSSRGFTDSRVSDQPSSRGFTDSRVSDQLSSRGYMESRVSDQPNSSRYRDADVANYSTFEGHQGSGLQEQSNYGQSMEAKLPDWPSSARYSEFGMQNSGGYREPETPYQSNSGGFKESEAPKTPAGGYHQLQNQPLPPPVVPPELQAPYNSALEKLVELENMAHMIAADVGQQPNSAPGMWDTVTQQAPASAPQTYTAGPQLYTPGPQTYTPGPQQYSTGSQPYFTGPPLPFSGPQPPQGPERNFTGPPIQPNTYQPFVRGVNPQQAPWPSSNFF